MTSTHETIPPAPSAAPDAAKRMTTAANAFLNALDAGQRARASFPYEGDERYEWAYTPIERNGLLLRDMTQEQRDAAMAMIDTAYSAGAQKTARQIISLEPILGQYESMTNSDSQWERSEEKYWFSVFGTPGGDQPWGFRAGGHHIGIATSIIKRELVAYNPLFFGSNPAKVKQGPHKGLRTLVEEEDWARALVRSLSDDQKKIAIVDAVAPADILTKNYRVADPNATPTGIAFSALSDPQRESLVKLVRHYVNRGADDLAANYWRHIESIGMDRWSFAWAGPEEPGEGHYYAVSAPNFVVEYDNTQNGANHIHSVLRDFNNDWGEDILAAHYKNADHHH